jgi:putative membrane protein
MNKLAYTITICAFILIASSCGKKAETDNKEIAENQNDEKLADTDQRKDADFAVAAADGGQLEVQLGQLALKNSSNTEIKKFGQSMIDDHSRANEELKALARQKGITLPIALSDKNQKDYEDLAKKTGLEFDKAYCEFMVKDHKEDIDEFKKEAEKGTDPEIKAWAQGKIATLEHHLMMAENTHNVVKDTK